MAGRSPWEIDRPQRGSPEALGEREPAKCVPEPVAETLHRRKGLTRLVMPAAMLRRCRVSCFVQMRLPRHVRPGGLEKPPEWH